MPVQSSLSSTEAGAATAPHESDGDAAPLARAATRYEEIRRFTEALCRPLTPEDCVIQPMPDASPTKWHLAHTSWFFETFILSPRSPGYQPFHPQFGYLFNSYYNAVGERHARPNRGLLSRPTLEEVYAYRACVDQRMNALLDSGDVARLDGLGPLLELGLHHEQQHQELILTDIKYTLSCNPLKPAYGELQMTEQEAGTERTQAAALGWRAYPEGIYWIGHDGNGFAFDNEAPRHRVFAEAFQLSRRLVTNGEYLAFMLDGGYVRPELWLSDGWNAVQANGWSAPLYWQEHDGRWWTFTLAGMREVALDEPVCHVSYYEADAYARWADARLPTEAEWEVAAAGVSTHASSSRASIEGNSTANSDGNFVESGRFHPAPAPSATGDDVLQLFGDVWEWTGSAYLAYPGFRAAEGAIGEYNGKFMCNQMVLRGGSCATSASHIRASYRNFFPPDARWQFSGIRLARDA